MPAKKRTDPGFTLVEILIVCAVIGIIAAIAIANLTRNIITANETNAQATLRSISTACENYASSHYGNFPDSENALIETTPPYLNQAYDGVEIRGYIFSLGLEKTGYLLTASPVDCGRTGTKIFSVSPTGYVQEEDCES